VNGAPVEQSMVTVEVAWFTVNAELFVASLPLKLRLLDVKTARTE
jgi:hypothetical protein